MGHSDISTTTNYINQCPKKSPACPITSTTVIDCCVKTLKRQYQTIAEMLSNACSGFGWNYEYKCIQVEPTVFEAWVQTNQNAKGLNNEFFLIMRTWPMCLVKIGSLGH